LPSTLPLEEDDGELPLSERGGKPGNGFFARNWQYQVTLRLEQKEEVYLVMEYETKVPSGYDNVLA
jgi:hypothetical protein